MAGLALTVAVEANQSPTLRLVRTRSKVDGRIGHHTPRTAKVVGASTHRQPRQAGFHRPQDTRDLGRASRRRRRHRALAATVAVPTTVAGTMGGTRATLGITDRLRHRGLATIRHASHLQHMVLPITGLLTIDLKATVTRGDTGETQRMDSLPRYHWEGFRSLLCVFGGTGTGTGESDLGQR